jgi:hypothetical protein
MVSAGNFEVWSGKLPRIELEEFAKDNVMNIDDHAKMFRSFPEDDQDLL